MERFYEIISGITEELQYWPRWKFVAAISAAVILVFSIFFFTYFHVDYNSVEIMESEYYTKEELRAKVLKGPFAYNSVLAPVFCSVKNTDDLPFVSGISVTSLSRNSLCVSVKEERSVGCIHYLDSYIYFDINGYFTDSSLERNTKLPFFRGIELTEVVLNEQLPFRGNAVLDTAIALTEIFTKSEQIADYVELDDANNISLIYGDIEVRLGKDQFLEDKMSRVIAILPKLEGQKGILHMESVTDVNKIVTFEKNLGEITEDNWNGGYDEDGNYTGEGEYDVHGNYVGPRPVDLYKCARAAWPGGYDEDGDYTGSGPYDKQGVYVGDPPTRESIEANGDWLGGYDKDGRYVTDGEYDRLGNHVGPRPEPVTPPQKDTYEEENDDYSDGYNEEYYDQDNEYYDEDYGYYSEDYDYYNEEYSYYSEEYDSYSEDYGYYSDDYDDAYY